MDPFSPVPGGTVLIDVAGTTANKLISKTPGIRQVRVMNNGTATAWIEFGKDSNLTTAATTGIPVGPGVTEVYTTKFTDGPLYVAAIAAGSTGKIYFTPGAGI